MGYYASVTTRQHFSPIWRRKMAHWPKSTLLKGSGRSSQFLVGGSNLFIVKESHSLLLVSKGNSY